MRYVISRERLTNREMAGDLGVDPRTLRSWAKRGCVPSWVNPANNYRYYDRDAVVLALCRATQDSEAR